MGKKNERITELEGELTAYKFLLRTLGDSIGVEIDTVTMQTAPGLHRTIMIAMRAEAARAPAPAPVAAPQPRRGGRRSGSWDTFDTEVDEQIDRLEDQGLTAPPGGALVPSADTDPDTAAATEVIANLARELGLPHDGTPVDMIHACYNEVLRIKNGGSDLQAPSSNRELAKGDSLADVVDHAHKQNSELRDRATQSNTLVSRIGAALQIPAFDAEGSQLLARIQIYEEWKHHIKRRIRELSVAPSDSAVPVNALLVEELSAHLARIMTKREWSDWLKARPVGITVAPRSDGLLIAPYPITIQISDIRLNLATDTVDAERLKTMVRFWEDLVGSDAASEEFCRAVNLQVLPILARAIAARQVPGPTEPDAA